MRLDFPSFMKTSIQRLTIFPNQFWERIVSRSIKPIIFSAILLILLSFYFTILILWNYPILIMILQLIWISIFLNAFYILY